MTDLGLKVTGIVLATLIGVLGYISSELSDLKGNVREEIGRSSEIDKKHENWLLSTSNRTLLTLERVTRLEAKSDVHHTN
jgi:hypothetical protein